MPLRLTAITLLLALAPQRAGACSCIPVRLSRTVLPADGTDGFPTDGVIRVFLTAFRPALNPSIAREYRLRDERGTLVPFAATVVGTRLDLRPRTPLAPSSRYVIEAVFAYDARGARLDDTTRLRTDAATLRGAFFPVSSFRTATGRARRRLAVPRGGDPTIFVAHGGGDCGPGVSLEVALSLPTVSPTDVLELRVDGTVVDTRPALGASGAYAGDLICDPDPVTLPADRPMHVELALLDASGNEMGATRWTTHQPTPRPAGWAASRSRPRRSPHWPPIRVRTVSPLADRGPPGCVHGFEAASRSELPPQWGHDAFLTSNGAAAWSVLGDDDRRTAVYRVDADARAARVFAGHIGLPAAGIADASAIFFVANTYDSSDDQISTLRAIGLDGRTLFRRQLSRDGDEFRLAAGGGRILSAWTARDAQSANEFLAWAVHDAHTGAPVLAPQISTQRAHMGSGLASAFVGDRFFLAYRSTPWTIALAVIASDGTLIVQRALGIRSDGPPDLVAMNRGAALVTNPNGEIAVTLLHADGRIARGAFIVSTGVGGRDNRHPRAAWNGELLAIAWETSPLADAYVTVVDASGRVAPALPIARPASTAGIAAIGRTFVASYITGSEMQRATMLALRCRATLPRGPPQLVQP